MPLLATNHGDATEAKTAKYITLEIFLEAER